jgi:hypothetical protein
VCSELAGFLGIGDDERVRAWAEANIARRSTTAEDGEISENVERIAGGALRRLGYQVGRVSDPPTGSAPDPVGPVHGSVGPVFNRPARRPDEDGAP